MASLSFLVILFHISAQLMVLGPALTRVFLPCGQSGVTHLLFCLGSGTSRKKPKLEQSDAGSDDGASDDRFSDAGDDVAGSDDLELDASADDPPEISGEDLEEAEDDEFDVDDEFGGFEETEKASEGPPFECLSRDGIVARQSQLIDKVSDFLELNSTSSRALLQHFSWEPEKVFTAWTEDSAKICKKVGIDLATASGQTVRGKKSQGECLVCYEETELYKLSCSHGYCKDCWKGYLSVLIKEHRSGITCPAPKCGRVLDEMIVLELAGEESLRKKFNDTLVASFVENNPLVRWCPGPGCGLAILLRDIQSERNESIKCKCGHYFCFRCGEEGHAPAVCDMQKEWKLKNAGGDDALNEKFLATISRPCPSCKNPIEKNGGCNRPSHSFLVSLSFRSFPTFHLSRYVLFEVPVPFLLAVHVKVWKWPQRRVRWLPEPQVQQLL